MPEDKNKKTVDIDTSGPEVDVEIKEDVPVQEFEVKEETVKEVVKEEPRSSTQETKVEKKEASDEKPEAKKDELEDTSKPESEVNVEQEAAPKAEKPSDAKVATESQAPSTSPQEASDENKTQKDELEDYSKDVQRRIAKLTKKWREAERQKDDALKYAEAVKIEKEATLKKYSALEGASVKDRESRIASGLLAAKAKLAEARANQFQH